LLEEDIKQRVRKSYRLWERDTKIGTVPDFSLALTFQSG
jgi:hypothetical protein